MKKVEFYVDGVKGKQRPRARMINGHPVIYTPRETKDYEKQIADAYLEAGGELFPKDVPIRVVVLIFHAVPKATSKKKRAEMLDQLTRPMKKPDVDNVVKCLDGLNGIAFEDDSQIVEIDAKKFWSNQDYLKVIVSDASL